MASPDKRVRAVIGTAGHVDHGKTTLVQGLTGIDTDRLLEEKQRGISIELGFAWLDVAGDRVAIIDVPGHERFVRQMIAGAAGIDLVLLVVAADEGVMPQTLEHLDICHILGVRRGAIVLTKTDLVDPEWLQLVREDVAAQVEGTFLEGAPIWSFAAGDDDSRDALRAGLGELVDAAERDGVLAARSPERPFKLSVDRAFTIRGFGTVVTGTTASGRLASGDAVVIRPADQPARVRGIQVHEEPAEAVGPGMRAALNLQGVDHDAISRGDVVTTPDGLESCPMFDGVFTALARLPEPLEDRSRVLVHVGTAQLEGTLAFLGRQALAPGETAPVQVRLDTPTVVLPGEPFVVRGFTVLERYGKTLGGGRALTPQWRRHRRTSERGAALIEALASGEPARIVEGLVEFSGDDGMLRDELWRRAPLDRPTLDAAVASSIASGELLEAGGRLFGRANVERLSGAAVEALGDSHRQRPARAGLAQEELRTRIRADLSADLFGAVVDALVTSGELERRGERLALSDFTPTRSPKQQRACEAVGGALDAGGLTPPRIQDLPEELDLPAADAREALELLLDEGAAVRVSKDLAFARGHLDALERDVVAYLNEHGTMDAGALKELTGASRKWTIPLGEYFDRIRLTIRVGDARRLRQ